MPELSWFIKSIAADMKTLFTLLAFAALLATAVSPMNAASRGRKSAPRPSAPVDTNDRITALHLTSVVVTIAATHEAKEYRITPATKITINGQPGTLSGLAVGMDVNVTTSPNEPTTAATIDAKTAAKR